MKIIIAGGSGHVGAFLAREFHREGHDVVVLSRKPFAAPWRVVAWDGRTIGAWKEELERADVVINLAGRSVNCRYGKKNREEITRSRIDSTHAIGQAILQARRPPPVWLQASTATIYEHRFDAPNDEASGILGGAELNAPDTWRFSIGVANAWEDAAREEAATNGSRLVLMRTAIVMSPDRGGPFDALLRLVRFGLGGAHGSGQQFVSWIHETDFVRAVRWLIANESIRGAVNLAAPHPLPNADFMRDLRHANTAVARDRSAGSRRCPQRRCLPSVVARDLRARGEESKRNHVARSTSTIRVARQRQARLCCPGARSAQEVAEKRTIGLPATEWLLKIGAFFLRTETELVLKSRYVVPGHLLEHGFTFDHPHWPEAARDLCAKWKENHEQHTAAKREPGDDQVAGPAQAHPAAKIP